MIIFESCHVQSTAVLPSKNSTILPAIIDDIFDKMENKNNEVALLVHSCDRYEFLYQGFQFFFNKHWDFTMPCNYYFATEEKQFKTDLFENIQSGKGEWSDRLRYLLTEKISENYVLYFQEDMWLDAKVNADFFKKLFELARKNDWKQVKLHSSNVYVTKPTELFIDDFNVAVLDNQASGYLMSHQITLWNKQFLISQLAKNEHPWRNERKATKRLKQLDPEIQHIDYFAENGQIAINNNLPAAVRSGYSSVSVNSTLDGNVLPYIQDLLNQADPEAQKYGLQLEHNFRNELTHDGLQKPRKVDIIKRIKDWIQGK